MIKKRLNAYLELGIVIVVWGIASVVIKGTLDGIEPIPFLTYRFFLSTLFALPFLPEILKLINRKRLLIYVLLYAILSTPLALGILFLGLTKTSVINLSLVQSIEPLLLAYAAHRLFHDHLSKRGKIGVGIALLGALLTVIEPFLAIKDISTSEGNILLIVYIISDLLSILILKKLMKEKTSARALTNFSFILAFVSFFFITLLTSSITNLIKIVKDLSFNYHLGVWYMALFSGTIAYALRAKAQKTLTVTDTSIFGYLSPIISTILAVFFLHEQLTPLFMIGAFMITIGVILVEYKRKI